MTSGDHDDLGRAVAANAELHRVAFRELHLGNLHRAGALFASGRQQVFANGWDGFVPYVCVAGAALASAEGDHRRAAILAGVAHTAFVELGQVPDPGDDVELASVRDASTAALGRAGFAAAYAIGQTLDPRTAFAEPSPW